MKHLLLGAVAATLAALPLGAAMAQTAAAEQAQDYRQAQAANLRDARLDAEARRHAAEHRLYHRRMRAERLHKAAAHRLYARRMRAERLRKEAAQHPY